MDRSKSCSHEQLRKNFDRMMREIDGPMDSYPWEDKQAYAAWLAQIYYFVCHATRLLSASAARLTIADDPMHIYMIDHCQEEKFHELLAERDVKALGYSIDRFPEHPSTCQLYQSQYYLIDYVNPMALLGCVLYLEGLSLHSAKRAYTRTRSTFGEKANEFLRVHTVADQDHVEAAFKMLQKCGTEQVTAINASLLQSAHIYTTMMEALASAIPRVSRKAA